MARCLRVSHGLVAVLLLLITSNTALSLAFGAGDGEGGGEGERAMVVLWRDYLDTAAPDALLLPLLEDNFNVQILEDEELVDSTELYRNLVQLSPSVIVHLVFGAPVQEVGPEVGCAVQQVITRLGIPLLSICLDVPRAVLTQEEDHGVWCWSGLQGASQVDVMLVHQRFTTRVRVWERDTASPDGILWYYDAAPHGDDEWSSLEEDMRIYQIVVALIISCVLDIGSQQLTAATARAHLESHPYLAHYLAARNGGKRDEREQWQARARARYRMCQCVGMLARMLTPECLHPCLHQCS